MNMDSKKPPDGYVTEPLTNDEILISLEMLVKGFEAENSQEVVKNQLTDYFYSNATNDQLKRAN